MSNDSPDKEAKPAKSYRIGSVGGVSQAPEDMPERMGTVLFEAVNAISDIAGRRAESGVNVSGEMTEALVDFGQGVPVLPGMKLETLRNES